MGRKWGEAGWHSHHRVVWVLGRVQGEGREWEGVDVKHKPG